MVKLDTSRYRFSFTTAALMPQEMRVVAESIIENSQFNFIEELGKGKSATGRKYYSELNKRLATLTTQQLQLLVSGDLSTQKQLCFLAVCKTYAFIKDFTVDVLRDKILVHDYQITDGDYISFLRGKMSSHEEIEKLTDFSQKKIRQVVFRILEQAGVIDSVKGKLLQPQILDAQSINAIRTDNPEWLKIFFFSDLDIHNLTS